MLLYAWVRFCFGVKLLGFGGGFRCGGLLWDGCVRVSEGRATLSSTKSRATKPIANQRNSPGSSCW